MKPGGVFVAAMLLTPTAALAAPGIVTESVSMRAGPGPPASTSTAVSGGDAWCDLSWSDDRGWVSSQYLEYLYRNRYVYLPDYVDVVDVPEVPFVLNSYWASYYSGRPWYHRRAYWSSYWQSHARFATQIPADRSTRLGRTETRTAATEGRSHTGVAAGVTREQRLANVRGAQAAQEQRHLAHVNGAGRTVQQPIAREHKATRFSAAPAARPAMPAHIAQPNLGRANVGHVGGPPMNAHAQMGAPHIAPAMPHVGGGGAPHVNAAPHVGGGAPAGGGPGHKQHRMKKARPSAGLFVAGK